MNASTQIIPMRFGVEIDEGEEFRRLAERTDARRLAEQMVKHDRKAARERRNKAAEAQERRVSRNIKLMGMGALSTCCGAATLLAMLTEVRVLAVFPLVLMAVVFLMGACEK